MPAPDGALAVTGVPDLDRADALVVLVDPFSFPVEPLLAELGADHPGLPVVGGLASARGDGGTLLSRPGHHEHGCGGPGVLAEFAMTACVSQGARPVGPEMAITAAEGNVIGELAGVPAVQRLREAVASLEPGGA